METKEKKAFEPSGLVPRSIVRTFERFRQQLLPGSETAAIREYRISRYQVLVSARCLFTLLTIPIMTNWLVSSWLLAPLIEHFWNTQQNEIFLNSYQEERAFAELEFFSEKLFFESLLDKETLSYGLYSTASSGFSLPDPKSMQPSYEEKELIIAPGSSKIMPLLLTRQHTFANHDTPANNLLTLPASTTMITKGLSKGTTSGTASLPVGYGEVMKSICPSCQVASGTYTNIKKPKNVSTGISPSTDHLRLTTYISSPPYNHRWHVAPSVSAAPTKVGSKDKVVEELLKGTNAANGGTGDTRGRGGTEDDVYAGKALIRELAALPEEALLMPFTNTSVKIREKVQEKILELAIYYNQQTILSITNIMGDLVSVFTLGCLFVWMRPEIAILKSFLIEAIYSLSDTTKSFLLILLTDLLVGFHSPRGWETALELLLKHFGLPENQDFVFLFVATFPVLLDTVFKYWIFRHLNKISPSTVATYHSMIE